MLLCSSQRRVPLRHTLAPDVFGSAFYTAKQLTLTLLHYSILLLLPVFAGNGTLAAADAGVPTPEIHTASISFYCRWLDAPNAPGGLYVYSLSYTATSKEVVVTSRSGDFIVAAPVNGGSNSEYIYTVYDAVEVHFYDQTAHIYSAAAASAVGSETPACVTEGDHLVVERSVIQPMEGSTDCAVMQFQPQYAGAPLTIQWRRPDGGSGVIQETIVGDNGSVSLVIGAGSFPAASGDVYTTNTGEQVYPHTFYDFVIDGQTAMTVLHAAGEGNPACYYFAGVPEMLLPREGLTWETQPSVR